MFLRVCKSDVKGRIRIPGSKSHTIRALFIASLADGCSVVRNPLVSSDTRAAVNTCRAFGADIKELSDCFMIQGTGGVPRVPADVVDVGNSGTTLRIAMMTAALVKNGYTVFTGDEQVRRRPLEPLITAMNNLGASALSTRLNGMSPVVVKGPVKGGSTELNAVTSQYLSSILINAPLADGNTKVVLTTLNEVPYVNMTLWWLDKQNIKYKNNNFESFIINGGQKYKSMDVTIPGDFSSATFFMVLSAISHGELILDNLDMEDTQGDKNMIGVLDDMGACVSINSDNIRVIGNSLKGRVIDLNSMPDALPAMAVAACFAQGETRLVNVPQARLKETDRIKVMCSELKKMGADIKELDDGLVVKKSKLCGCCVNGHGDHRVVMALAVAGLNTEGETIIDTAESVKITFPEFVQLIRKCGGIIEMVNG